MKTTFKLYGHTVILRAIDPMTGEPMVREFSIPMSGGYIREGDSQVCQGLAHRGNTLTADDAHDLLRTIRREWKAYRKWAATA